MTRFFLLSDHCGFLIWGALSDERTGLSFTIAAVFASADILRSESRGDHGHVLLSHVGFVVDKVALGQVFSEFFGFSCQF
jgi:hypothetical protein